MKNTQNTKTKINRKPKTKTKKKIQTAAEWKLYKLQYFVL